MAFVDSGGVNDAPTFVPPGPGSVTTDIASGSDDLAQSIALQSDGKILAAGATAAAGTDEINFALVRYNTDGSLDTSFNGSGKVITQVGGLPADIDVGWDIAVQQDGKILLVGASYTLHTFALVRYKSDGHLDTSFNGTGKVVVDLGAGNKYDFASSVVVQSDGKIVVAGTSFESGSQDFALMRFNSDGSLDAAFNGGKVLTDFSGASADYGNSIALQPNGKIVVAGVTYAGSGDTFPDRAAFDIALARYNADGTLDTTFNGTGKLVTDLGASANDSAKSIAVQSDGKIVVAGYSGNDFAVLRYNADGSLDTTFNGSGIRLVDLNAGSFDAAYSLSVQADGKIIVAGYSDVDQIALVRLTSSGSLDASFNGTGKVLTTLGAGTFIDSVSVQQDGKIVVAGNVRGASDDIAVVRYNTDGSLDLTFGALAPTTLGGTFAYSENAAPIALDASVAIYDTELAALSGGAGNYEGASITLARHLGASTQDVFSGLNNLSFVSGNAVLSGVTVGSCTNTGGTLSIAFNANATQARVNELLSSLGYSNSSDAPPSQVIIDWSFNDGNSGAQGTGGALIGTGSTTVNIAAMNDAPTLNAGTQSRQLLEAGGTANATPGTPTATIAMSKSDQEGAASWDAGALVAAGWTTTNGGTTYTHTGTYGTAVFATATGLVTYTLDNVSSVTQALDQGDVVSDAFTLQVTDGSLTASAAATFSITGSNDAPTASAGPQSRQLVAAGDDGGIVGVSSASITISKSDVDGAPVMDMAALLSGGWSTANAGVTFERSGIYGIATLTTATGVVNYVLDNERPATKALLAGDVVTDAFDITVSDGSLGASANAAFSIWGATNAPLLEVGAQSNALVEAGGLANGIPGTANATIAVALQTVDSTGGWDTAALLSHGWSATSGGNGFTKAGTFGVANFDTLTGIVAYALNDTSSATQALASDQAVTDEFTVYAANGSTTSSAHVVFSIEGTNDAPTLTSFASEVATTTEATEVEVSIAALIFKGNEGDVDGSVVAFIVSAVESGTLRIGTSPATATAWISGANDLIDGATKAYWTPASGANGSVAAFEVIAIDELQAQSGGAMPVHLLVVSDGVIMGTPDADTLGGTPEDELVLALAGNDTIESGGGADTIDGGAGIDTVSVDLLSELDDLVLQDVERVQQGQLMFAIDTQAATETLEGGNTWQAAALYRAAFGAVPDTANLSHWTSVADQSEDMGALAQSMIDYYAPGVSSIDLVVYLYRALVGVLPTEQQILYFVGKIGPGKPFETQGDLFAAAASDPINTNHMLEFSGSMQQLDPGWF